MYILYVVPIGPALGVFWWLVAVSFQPLTCCLQGGPDNCPGANSFRVAASKNTLLLAFHLSSAPTPQLMLL